MSEFRGTGVAVVTPFLDGQVDFDRLTDVLEHIISGGVDYIVSLGTTGEAVTLSPKEIRQVLDHTIKVVAGRKPIVAGNFGGNDTAALCRYINGFDFNGIDAMLSSSPSYNKPSQEGIFQHYKAMAEASPVPIILYNVPGRTSSNISAETTVRIARTCPNVIGIKEASGDLVQSSEILRDRPEGFLVISGDDPTALGLIYTGGDGVISVIGNAFPHEWSSMIRNALGGEADLANAEHNRLLSLHTHLYSEGNPAGIKAALNIRGLCQPEVRLPLTRMSDEGIKAMSDEIVKLTNIPSRAG